MDGEEFSVRELRSSGRRKALKGEAQERWELKEAFADLEADPRRVGNQTQVRDFLDSGQWVQDAG
jgi:hypothetical protein